MINFKRSSKGKILIKRDFEDITHDFSNLECAFGLETWKNKKNINLDVTKGNDGYNVKTFVQNLEHEIVQMDVYDGIDLSNYTFVSGIKQDKYTKKDKFLRINITDNSQFEKNEMVSGQIIVNNMWYYGNTYGLNYIYKPFDK